VNYKLDGTYGFSGPAPYSSSNETSVLTVLRFGGVSGGTIYDQWGDGSNNFAPYSEYDQGWVSENIACQSTSCFDFQGTIDVQGSNPVVPLDLSLGIDCSDLNCSEELQPHGDNRHFYSSGCHILIGVRGISDRTRRSAGTDNVRAARGGNRPGAGYSSPSRAATSLIEHIIDRRVRHLREP